MKNMYIVNNNNKWKAKINTYLSMMPPCPGIMSPKSLILNALLNPSKICQWNTNLFF